MPQRILMELAIFLSPFVMFGLYRWAIRDAQAEGRKAWPINALFGIGAVLAVGLWVFFILREERDPNICREPSTFNQETGELVPGREFACESRIDQVGQPLTETPGRSAPPPADDTQVPQPE